MGGRVCILRGTCVFLREGLTSDGGNNLVTKEARRGSKSMAEEGE